MKVIAHQHRGMDPPVVAAAEIAKAVFEEDKDTSGPLGGESTSRDALGMTTWKCDTRFFVGVLRAQNASNREPRSCEFSFQKLGHF